MEKKILVTDDICSLSTSLYNTLSEISDEIQRLHNILDGLTKTFIDVTSNQAMTQIRIADIEKHLGLYDDKR